MGTIIQGFYPANPLSVENPEIDPLAIPKPATYLLCTTV